MRSVLPLATALFFFGVGFLGVRWLNPREVSSGAEGAQRQLAASMEGSERASGSEGGGSAPPGQDWREALAKFGGNTSTMAEKEALVNVLLRMSPQDFAASADDMVARLKPGESALDRHRCDLAEVWMDRWLEIDRVGALRYLKGAAFWETIEPEGVEGLPIQKFKHCALGGVSQALAAREPDWLRGAIGDFTGATKEMATFALLENLTRRDPARASQVLASFPDGAERSSAMTGYIAGLAKGNGREALEFVLKESSADERGDWMQLIFSESGRYGQARVRELLAAIPDPVERRRWLVRAVCALGDEGREDILPMIKEESVAMFSGQAGVEQMETWGSVLPIAARGQPEYVEWAFGFAPDQDRRLFRTLVKDWAMSDPQRFITWLGKHAEGLDQVAVEHATSALWSAVAMDPTGVHQWAEALPAGWLREQAIFQVAVRSNEPGGGQRAIQAYSSVAGADAKGNLAGSLAVQFTNQEGAAVADWAMRLPAGLARNQAVTVLGNLWSRSAPGEMAKWLEQQPSGPERDSLLKELVNQVSIVDPLGATQWLEQMEDRALRTEAARQVFDHWKTENPVGARQWIRGLDGVDHVRLNKILRTEK